MALNIIDLIKGQLGPALVSQTAVQLGESESAVSKAISALLPAVVGGMANHAGNPTLVDSITGASSGNLLGNLLGHTQGNETLSSVLSVIFGDKLNTVIHSTSTFANTKENSTMALTNIVTGAALGSIGKYAADNNLKESGITTLLEDQKGIVTTLLPAGISLASLGIGEVYNTDGTTTAQPVVNTEEKIDVTRAGQTHVNPEPVASEDGGSIWKWLLPLILLLLAAWFLWRQCNKPVDNNTSVVTSEVVDTTFTEISDNAVSSSQTMTDIDLNGTTLKGYNNGLEMSMINFLKSDGYANAADDAALKDNWYEFDNVNFKMNSSTEMNSGSMDQLNNLAQILKAYPDAKIKIGAHADNTGGDAINQKLSQERASYIKSELDKLGVASQITGTEGYSNKFAEVPAGASDAERAEDRDIAVRFTK